MEKYRGSESVAIADLRDVLVAFQRILKQFAMAVQLYSGVGDICTVVKKIWFSYLSKWNQFGGIMIPSSQSSSVCEEEGVTATAEHYKRLSGVGSSVVLLLPSRLLLLGVISIACRILRSWVSHLDVTQWCREGIIPYSNAFELLDADLRLRIKRNRSFYRVFIRDYAAVHTISSSNILFHTLEVAKMLNINIPPLNAPFIARAFMLSLGLPQSVPTSYTAMMQFLNGSVTNNKFRCHFDHIVASIFLACKLDPSWRQWATLVSPIDNIACSYFSPVEFHSIIFGEGVASANVSTAAIRSKKLVTHPVMLLITPHCVDKFLVRTLQNVRTFSELGGDLGIASFNKALRRSVAVCPAIITGFNAAPTENWVESVRQSHIALHCYFQESRLCITTPDESPKVSVLIDQRMCSSLDMQQLGILERIAGYAQLSPALLHTMIEDVDDKLVAIAVDSLTRFTKSIEVGRTSRIDKRKFHDNLEYATVSHLRNGFIKAESFQKHIKDKDKDCYDEPAECDGHDVVKAREVRKRALPFHDHSSAEKKRKSDKDE